MAEHLPHASTPEELTLYIHHLFALQDSPEAGFMPLTRRMGNWSMATKAANGE